MDKVLYRLIDTTPKIEENGDISNREIAYTELDSADIKEIMNSGDKNVYAESNIGFRKTGEFILIYGAVHKTDTTKTIGILFLSESEAKNEIKKKGLNIEDFDIKVIEKRERTIMEQNIIVPIQDNNDPLI